jgi:hypothetical protein
MIDLRDKLIDLDCPLNDATLLHHVMLSLPPVFEPFKINYNGSENKWDIAMLVAKCSQDEERLCSQNPDFANVIRHEGHKSRNRRLIHSNRAKKDKKPAYEAPKKDGSSSSKALLYYHCGLHGHERNECEKFKKWCAK